MPDVIKKFMNPQTLISGAELGAGALTGNPALISQGGQGLTSAALGDVLNPGAPKAPSLAPTNAFAPAAAPVAPPTDYPASSGATGIAAPSFAGTPGGGGGGDQNAMIQAAIQQAMQQQGGPQQQAYGSF